MTSVNEQLVREYLETLGFCVRQVRKYSVIARAKASWEEADMLGINLALRPGSGEGTQPAPGLWGACDLVRVPAVVVSVRGWHSDRFTPQMLAKTPELVRFASPKAMASATATLRVAAPAPVLVLPDLPVAARERQAAIDFLLSAGIQGILLFQTLLLDLLDRVDVKKSYEKSDVLQLLRILKVHRLVQSRQLELPDWSRPARRHRVARKQVVDATEPLLVAEPPREMVAEEEVPDAGSTGAETSEETVPAE